MKVLMQDCRYYSAGPWRIPPRRVAITARTKIALVMASPSEGLSTCCEAISLRPGGPNGQPATAASNRVSLLNGRVQ